MFYDAISFNQPLNNWNVSNVKLMASMFKVAKSFNQPLDNWNVSNVTDISRMFEKAASFNQPLDKWNFKEVQYIANMFTRANAFQSELPNFAGNDNEEDLLEELGLPPDFKPEIKRDQEPEKAHKKSIVDNFFARFKKC